MRLLRIGLLVAISSVVGGWGLVQPAAVRAQQQADVDFKAQFLQLCDIACKELNKEYTQFSFADQDNADPKTHHSPFFEDSHAVRSLAVVYDLTGKKKYLDTCKHWSDQMIAFQNKMVPQRAYYMNYGGSGRPSEAGGGWYVSDDASVGMAVFATAVRCTDKNDKARYLDSVESFAKVVMADRIGKNGGIIKELWGGFRDEWWCSTATFRLIEALKRVGIVTSIHICGNATPM